jgi:hypothetical protein
MTHCINDGNKARVLFKGRWLCSVCYEFVTRTISKIILQKEVREKKVLGNDEILAINRLRKFTDPFGRAFSARGTRFSITKGELQPLTRSKTRLHDICEHPDCDKRDIGLIQKEDGSYTPACAEHAALISITRDRKTRKK